MRRLILFNANLILSFRIQHTGTLGEIKDILQLNHECTHKTELLMQGSIVYSKTQVVTNHYQRFSGSQYWLQMQVQAQQKCSNALTQRMILFSHTMV
ncbi:hypothetical protein H5410_020915 [Solanum commersonii]|uniref:Uncharacterized protein n=1 Tax=Solanum commersonii TaxID=4109 RepID=A0A9J5ZAF9_SOLCO|nr:hypothetical protein H5410_020915 [Solanum commersonii]